MSGTRYCAVSVREPIRSVFLTMPAAASPAAPSSRAQGPTPRPRRPEARRPQPKALAPLRLAAGASLQREARHQCHFVNPIVHEVGALTCIWKPWDQWPELDRRGAQGGIDDLLPARHATRALLSGDCAFTPSYAGLSAAGCAVWRRAECRLAGGAMFPVSCPKGSRPLPGLNPGGLRPGLLVLPLASPVSKQRTPRPVDHERTREPTQ
jgi:hypothetical protein